ncbi:MAG TPA: alpha/beta fold hydrolase, partial [Blastocatellia bacterium]|nr:alpha/beta fold hydrolase [Blastocatellia bacterium]
APAKALQQRPRRLRWLAAFAYLALLLVSHAVRALSSEEFELPSDVSVISARAVDGEALTSQEVRIAFRDYRPRPDTGSAAVILLHGSPGTGGDFHLLASKLRQRYRLIIPDLPGFGYSTREIPDYSIRAHARYVIQLMDRLDVESAHVVGFSMGGGVALNLADIAPARVLSLTMLSAIGVQEMELLGDYYINHTLHGLQLCGLWLLREAFPHMGWLDDAMIGVAYARNFYDTDQRPLRGVLARFGAPMLIIHGTRDVLVPVEAAREHHRLVAQSEIHLVDENHFALFTRGEQFAPVLSDFLDRVEGGRALTQSGATPERKSLAARPYDPADAPKAKGVTALVFLILIVIATLVSEDLTSIGVGVMVAQGRVSYLLGAFSCFLGIFVGDVLLFLAGRYLGRPALGRAPLKWFIRPEDVERSSAWFSRRGIPVIAASRFVPGARLPTYFAAGLLNTSLLAFSIYFLIAGIVWTPLLVGLSAAIGGEVLQSALLGGQNLLTRALAAVVIVYLSAKLLIALASFKGRRLLLSSWRRKTRWEFWPPWMFYPPVFLYIVYLAIKHRGLSVFTSVNPAIPASGFIGESKAAILGGLAKSNGYIARYALIKSSPDPEERIAQARAFMSENGLSFPVVLKPDAGQRGSGVAVARSEREIEEYLRRSNLATIIQEYIEGPEFGVFYYRYPDQASGKILSITEKRFPVVEGDGRSTLEHLILRDDRAVCKARFYLKKQGDRLWEVLERGERLQLVELGTHCRGAIFLDGRWIKTEALERAIDEISKGFEGFYFGRFDIRARSVEEFKQGEGFKVIELNGVTSEATHIYDPKNNLFAAYKVLFEQWRIAFEIGAANRARGIRPVSIRALARMLIEYRQQSGSHPE